MREIVLDTETTGLDPNQGDRIVEIGAIELINHVPSGVTYHQYINPERDMPVEAFRVHGLSEDFLKGHPRFAEIAQGFLDFAAGDPFIIHNAEFDMRFLNFEFEALKFPRFANEIKDTLKMARRKFPGAPASLDALCKRFGIDNTGRDLHGALIDSYLLADVYLELIGGREPGFALENRDRNGGVNGGRARTERPPRPAALPSLVTAEEQAAHDTFLDSLKSDDLVWRWTAQGSSA